MPFPTELLSSHPYVIKAISHNLFIFNPLNESVTCTIFFTIQGFYDYQHVNIPHGLGTMLFCHVHRLRRSHDTYIAIAALQEGYRMFPLKISQKNQVFIISKTTTPPSLLSWSIVNSLNASKAQPTYEELGKTLDRSLFSTFLISSLCGQQISILNENIGRGSSHYYCEYESCKHCSHMVRHSGQLPAQCLSKTISD